MSMPPLPPVFGNYALDGSFAQLAPPPAISWLPTTLGWRIVGGLLALWLVYRGVLAIRDWYRNRYRREASLRLRQLATNSHSATALGSVNAILKLAALAAFPRREVASLHGVQWVEFLNGQCETTVFDSQLGKQLSRSSRNDLREDEQQVLINAGIRWLQEHRNQWQR